MKILKNRAFTLAEVLITLGIIGVVAAITLPNLMTAYKARVLRSQFMKSYSLIQQAYKMMEADGQATYPSYYDRMSNGTQFSEVFKHYFTGITACSYRKNAPCFNDTVSPYKSLDGGTKASVHYFDDGQFALKDGTLLMIENPSGVTGTIQVWVSVDINGIKGQPNQLGVDVFTFELTDDGFKAMGDDGTKFVGDSFCSLSGKGYRNGMSCANKAKNDPDYFKRISRVIK